MKKFIKNHKDILTVLSLLFVWRMFFLILQMNKKIIPTKDGFLGFLRIANFDGTFYLSIAQYGYKGLDQAFFPLFPLVIRALILVGFEPVNAALIIVVTSLFLFLYILTKLIKIDYPKAQYIWVLLFYLSFPTTFFLGSVYTESFFLFLTISSFYFARKEKLFISSIFAAFASATRVVGILLLPALVFEIYEQQKKQKRKNYKKYLFLGIIPLGLLSYMFYLWRRYNDPILFVHQQPLFGAGRSGGDIVLLPQVIYRYIKIFLGLSYQNLTFWISVTEFITLILATLLLYLAYKKGIRKSYIIFSACALFSPTFSGTLSSLPRYALVSFAIFICLGLLKNKYLKIFLILLGLILQSIFAMFFLQGYFVS